LRKLFVGANVNLMPRTGRPKVDNPRRNVQSVRLSDDELIAVMQAAEKAGQDVGPWIRDKAVAAARRAK
jgi:hypothetical protein